MADGPGTNGLGAKGLACAPTAAQVGESQVATASRVRSWLAVEQPGAWGPEALTESGLDARVGMALAAHGRRAGVRTILIRRPRGLASPARRRCFLAHSGRRSWVESLDLDEPSTLLDLDLSALATDRPPGIGTPVKDPVFLVCTNGRHDRCCADFGRPLVRSLVRAGVDGVWECSHIGGDRFAANMVCLPEGIYLGRIEAGDGPAVANAYAAGTLSLDHYRGRSCYPTLVQAAENAVRREAGITAIDGLALVAHQRLDEHRAEVTFAVTAASGPRWRARVSRSRLSLARPLTCRSAGDARPWTYHVEDLSPLP